MSYNSCYSLSTFCVFHCPPFCYHICWCRWRKLILTVIIQVKSCLGKMRMIHSYHHLVITIQWRTEWWNSVTHAVVDEVVYHSSPYPAVTDLPSYHALIDPSPPADGITSLVLVRPGHAGCVCVCVWLQLTPHSTALYSNSRGVRLTD